jgi:hypothetical protein
MSGGHFDYDQYKIGVIREDVEGLIKANEWDYSENTIARFHEAVYFLTMAEIYAQRIDWLVSGDDGEDSFHRRLEQELEKVKNEYYYFIQAAQGSKE